MEYTESHELSNPGIIGSQIKETSRPYNGAVIVLTNIKPSIVQMNYLDSLRLPEEPSCLTRKSTRVLLISKALEDGWRGVIGHASQGIYMKEHRR